ncbi:MAG TPA: FUSC family protein [Rubrivivax sp.]|nr:FUSC family protein [Rubrivivax sp.]HPO17870.1 FUSC family protein [Rubrivivax sp.]
MKLLERILEDDLRGVRYAANVFAATTALWLIVRVFGDANPIWAISSMVATSDPQLKQSLATFRARLINTLVGSAIGLLFIAVGRTDWELPSALALSVLVSTYLVRVPTMWRQAPITAAIVVAGSLQHHDKLGALERGAARVGEVLFGCLVGIACAWLLSKLWPPREASARHG